MKFLKKLSLSKINLRSGLKKLGKCPVPIRVLIALFLLAVALFCFIQSNFWPYKKNNSETITTAVNLFEAGNESGAIKILESAVRKDPNNQESKTNLAQLYYRSKNYDKLIDFVQKNNLKSNTIFNMMASAYQSKGETDNAEIYYKKAIELAHNSSKSYINIAAFYQAQGKLDQSLKVIEQGLSTNSKSTGLLISAASICLKMGNKQEAKNYVNRALAVDPNNSQAKAILKEV